MPTTSTCLCLRNILQSLGGGHPPKKKSVRRIRNQFWPENRQLEPRQLTVCDIRERPGPKSSSTWPVAARSRNRDSVGTKSSIVQRLRQPLSPLSHKHTLLMSMKSARTSGKSSEGKSSAHGSPSSGANMCASSDSSRCTSWSYPTASIWSVCRWTFFSFCNLCLAKYRLCSVGVKKREKGEGNSRAEINTGTRETSVDPGWVQGSSDAQLPDLKIIVDVDTAGAKVISARDIRNDTFAAFDLLGHAHPHVPVPEFVLTRPLGLELLLLRRIKKKNTLEL